MINRRHFLQTLSLAAAATFLPIPAWAKSSKKGPVMAAHLGLVPMNDLAVRLGLVNNAGFKAVSAPDNWYDMESVKELSQAIRKADLSCPVVHVPVDILGLQDLELGLDRLTSMAKSLGASWVIATGVANPPRGPRKMAEYLDLYAQRLAWEKINFAYAPHANDFKPRNGEIAIETLLMRTEPTLVGFEMDPAAMEQAGADALQYLDGYANRFSVLRLNVTGDDQTLNEGDSINWSGIRDAITPSLIIAGAAGRPDPNLVEANANREFWEGIQKEEDEKKKLKKEKVKKEKKVKVKTDVPENDIEDGSK